MSRNGSGTFSVVNTFLAGAVITAAGHNQNWADAATEFSNSVAADGQTSMTGALKASNGTVAAPALTFASDPDTGFYRIGANNIGAAVSGAKALDIAATGVSFLGTTTNDNAATGYVGEYVSSTVLIGAAVAMTTGSSQDITSISLTAGDWDVYGTAAVTTLSGFPSVTLITGWISTTSNVEAADPNEGAKAILSQSNAGAGDNSFAELSGLRKRVTLSATTTIYLGIRGAFLGGSIGRYGFIGARRVR